VGPRRGGKSSLLRLTIADLLKQGVGWNRICFLPLEDERLRSEHFEPDTILQAFMELYPENPSLSNVFFMFDEVQYLTKWEWFINRIHEQISRQVLITGSNSHTLHTEVAGVLRGRGLPVELLPFSFSEYLNCRDIPYKERGEGKIPVIAAFRQYLQEGGYPETIGNSIAENNLLLQEYFNAVLYRDIIDQERPANFSYLRYLFHRIADNTGKTIALRKIFFELKSRGYSLSQGSLYQMADLAEAVYLYKRISRWDTSLIKRENAEKKCYFIDNGMLTALNNRFSQNWGALLENVIFWHLYRQYGNIYTTDIFYYKDANHECDFVLYREGGNALPIQVCYQLNTDETRQRELKGLVKACEQTNSPTGIIITLDQEEEMNYKEKKIKIIPAWKWCARPHDLYAK
jgi:predicted AAA+ superfamily ATPase